MNFNGSESFPRRLGQSADSLSDYSGTQMEQDILGLERIPSLQTDYSRHSTSYESPQETTAIFGASHWPGILPFDNRAEKPATAAGETLDYSVGTEWESKSWGLDSLCGSVVGPILTHPGTDAPQARIQYEMQTPQHSNNYVPVDQFGTPGEWLLGKFGSDSLHTVNSQNWSHGLGSKQYSNVEVAISNFMHPHPMAQPLQLSHKVYSGYSPQSHDPPRRALDTGIPSCDQRIPWDPFVVEDGFRTVAPPVVPHRKGTRNGPLPANKARITAERRRKGSTCMKCRIARVEVRTKSQLNVLANVSIQCDGQDPCQTCAKSGQSGPLAYPCLKANFSDIVNSGSCNYICERSILSEHLDYWEPN